MRLRPAFALVAALVCAAPAPAWSWSNHGLLTYWAFKGTAEVDQAPDVVVESFDDFLRANEQEVANALDGVEAWARAHVVNYPPRPDELAYRLDPSRDAAGRRKAFAEALRISPDVRLALFAQALPGLAPDAARAMRFSEVSTLREPAFSMMRCRARLSA